MRALVLMSALLLAAPLFCSCRSDDELTDQEDRTFFDRLQGTQREKEADDKAKRREREDDSERAREQRIRREERLRETRQGEIKVVWEALAHEKRLFAETANRRPQGAQAPQTRILFLSESHPEARKATYSRDERERERYSQAVVLPDHELMDLVEGLEKRDFFDYAQPTFAQQSMWDSESARGRVTVERNGKSRTLLSLRGQGRNGATKKIPAIYSEAKRAIMVLRNRTGSLNLTQVRRGSSSLPSDR